MLPLAGDVGVKACCLMYPEAVEQRHRRPAVLNRIFHELLPDDRPGHEWPEFGYVCLRR